MTDLQRMDKERKKRTDSILNLTLEIIYLLTGEDYKVVKKTSSEYVTTSNLSRSSRGWVNRQRPVMESTTPIVPERNNDKKILEVINKIIELLTRKVPIRCQDVTVCPSTEEWEYIEGHKDVMMENQPPLISTDTRDTRRDVPSKAVEEGHVRIKEENVPLEISTDGRYKMYTTEKSPLISHHDATKDDDFPIDTTEEVPITPNIHLERPIASLSSGPQGRRFPKQSRSAAQHSACDTLAVNDQAEEEEVVHILVKEEDISAEICSGGETEDEGVNPSSSKEKSTTPTLHAVVNRADLSSNHTTRRGAKTFVCSDCGQSFRERVDLVIHRRSHTVEKPYACPECGKCYSQRALLNRHQKAHAGLRPYPCSVCGKSFSHSQYLVLHQRSHTGEKPYSCNECGKCFFRSDHLIRHRRFHTGEKPYSCAECGKCFSIRFCLTEHERIHTGERPYSCSECGKGFTSKSNLASHARVHTGHHPYSCSECGKRFSKKSYLMTHLQSHRVQEAPVSDSDT